MGARKTTSKTPKTPAGATPAAPAQMSFYDAPAQPKVLEADAKKSGVREQGPAPFQRATVVTDGSNYGQPGPAGWAAIVIRGGKVQEFSGPLESATNNQAELNGVIHGLEQLRPGEDALVISDSQYVVNGVNKYHLIKKATSGAEMPNAPLWVRLGELVQGRVVTFEWVRGHDGHPQNERADVLAKQAGLAEKERQEKAAQLAALQASASTARVIPFVSGVPLRIEYPKGHQYPVPPVHDDDLLHLAGLVGGDLGKLITWLVESCQAGIFPDTPIVWKPGVTGGIQHIVWRLRYSLLNRGGQLSPPDLEDLQRLYRLFRRGKDLPAYKLGLQVIHRDVPKMVGIVFNALERLIMFHESTLTQVHGPTRSPGGVDRAALVYCYNLGVQEFHHWFQPGGPLFVVPLVFLLEEGHRLDTDGRDRYFLTTNKWEVRETRDYNPPWVDAREMIVLDPWTCQPVDVPPTVGKTPAPEKKKRR